MIHKIFTVKNKLGLHARPCALIVQKIKDFKSTVTFKVNKDTVNAKSILSLLNLVAPINTKVEITADGEDELLVMSTITALFDDEFDEAYRSPTTPI